MMMVLPVIAPEHFRSSMEPRLVPGGFQEEVHDSECASFLNRKLQTSKVSMLGQC